MKSINQYIVESEISKLNEGLLSKLTNWFKNLFKSQETLENKTIKVDVKNIKGPDKPTKLKDIEANKEEMNLINNPKVGFPVTSMIIKQKNKYLTKEDPEGNKKEYETFVNRYFYVDNANKYDVGIILFDDKTKNDNNYVNMINIEVIDHIENKQEVLKYINDVFETSMKRNKFKGAQHIKINTKISGLLNSLGYKSQNNDTNILFKNFK